MNLTLARTARSKDILFSVCVLVADGVGDARWLESLFKLILIFNNPGAYKGDSSAIRHSRRSSNRKTHIEKFQQNVMIHRIFANENRPRLTPMNIAVEERANVRKISFSVNHNE